MFQFKLFGEFVELNINISQFESIVNKFQKSVFTSEKGKHLENISELFTKIVDPLEKKQAIHLMKEKVFESISADVAMKDITISKSINSLIKQAPEDLKNLYIDKKQFLSIEDFLSIQTIKTATTLKEKLMALGEIQNRHQKDIHSILFDKVSLDEIIIGTGDLELINSLLENKEYVNHIKNQVYPFFIGLQNKNKDVVARFIDLFKNESIPLNKLPYGIDLINIITESKLDVEDKIYLIDLAFKNGCSVNGNEDVNYLSSAINSGEEKLITFFIENGVDINRISRFSNNSPIFEALLNKNYQTFEKLLSLGADVTVGNSFDNRTLLDQALDTIDLEACRLLNKYVPQIVNSLLQEDMNVILKMKAVRMENYKEKVKAYHQFEVLKNQSELEMKIKQLSHSHSIKGHSPVLSDKLDKFVNLEGFYSYKFYKNINKTIKNSLETLSEGENSKVYKNISESLLFASEKPSAEDIKKRFDEGKWAIIYTGFEGHAVTVLLKKGESEKDTTRLIICNRGLAMTTPVHSFAFNPKNLSTEDIQSLMDAREKPEEEYVNLLFKELPKKLDLKKGKAESIINKKCRLESQTVGNCSYASPEMATKTMIFLESIEQKKIPGGLLGKNEQIDQVVSEVSKDFEVMRALTRLQHIREYLEIHQKEGFQYEVDSFLVGKSLAVLWSSNMDNELVKKELKEVEVEFLNVLKKRKGEEFALNYNCRKLFEIVNGSRINQGVKIKRNDVKVELQKAFRAFDWLISGYRHLEVQKDPQIINQMEKDFKSLVSDLKNIDSKPVLVNYRLNKAKEKLKELVAKYELNPRL